MTKQKEFPEEIKKQMEFVASLKPRQKLDLAIAFIRTSYEEEMFDKIKPELADALHSLGDGIRILGGEHERDH